jgi:murein DD-endopeptidase MepM/ murein hydrolase activator NlpD
LINELNSLKYEFNIINNKTNDVQKLLDIIEQKDSVIYQSLFLTSNSIQRFESGFISEYEGSFNDTINNIGDKLSDIEMRLEKTNYYFRKLIIEIGINDNRLKHTPAIQPISNSDLQRTSSGFGMRFHPILKINKMHGGMDFVAPIGTPIYATADGIIEISSNDYYGYGKYIKINHEYNYKTAYGHLFELKVKKGQLVKRGEIIGLLGNTGLSTGPHLHYEVIFKNKFVNPINYYFHDLTAEQYEEMVYISSNIEKSLD